ncbi:hypothetical protein BIX20_23500 [Salmonella enterica]|nr:hypothetical protein [Salmonella enterica]EAO9987422.1 hypothetical protein [Salmonella enterica]EBA5739452.1 hypothetical protein [Salmonella enterica]EBQ5221892.1 hypothetical protein [Salmonella enterica]EDO5203638.1 hypothetical protein [Salmonella enterica]
MNNDKAKQANTGHSFTLAKAKTGMQISPELLKQFEAISADAGKAILENCTTRIELKQQP